MDSDPENINSDAATPVGRKKRRGRPAKKKSKATKRRDARKRKQLVLQSISQSGSQKSNTQNDSLIKGGNRQNRGNNFEWKADEMWKLGNLIGIFGRGNEREIIQKLLEMEDRDRSSKGKNSVEVAEIGDLQMNR